jgi:hypothetical protein
VTVIVFGAVEGVVDDAVVRRIVRATDHEIGPIHVKDGKQALLQKLHGYNAAALFVPWLVLVDLNGDAPCAPPFVAQHLPTPKGNMLFRVAVRQVEAWLLADRARFARFLRVSPAKLSNDPDSLPNAKRVVGELAHQSTDRRIREEVAPRPGSGLQVGPAYVARMIEFIGLAWEPDEAAVRSDSLRRCLDRLRSLQD